MAELCPTHKLALASDGKCVLCRRPKHAVSFDAGEESIAGRAFTTLLGLGLLAGIAALGYAWSLPKPSVTAARPLVPAFRSMPVTAAEPLLLGDASAGEQQGLAIAPVQADLDAGASDALARVEPEPSYAQRAAPKRPPRTVGARIVDPKLAAARREVKVIMYSAPWCFICDRARTFLHARDVDLEEHDVDRSANAARELAKINSSGSIPTFVIEQKTIVGFHPWGLEDAIDDAARKHYCADDLEGAVCERPRR